MIRRFLSLDTETCLIRPAQLAPPLVVVTWQEQGQAAGIEHHSTVEPRLKAWLEDDSIVFVLHNAAFDFAVLAERFPALRDLIFQAYAKDRVTDTMLRQQLLDIAAGCYRGRVDAKGKRIVHKYDLQSLAKRCGGIELLKDGWRMSYSEFLDVPLSEWPARAREVQAAAQLKIQDIQRRITDATKAKDKELVKALSKERDGLVEMVASDPNRCTEYPIDDAKAALAVCLTQEAHAERFLKDQYRQARAAFGLYLSSCWGICVDAEGAKKLREQIQAEKDELEDDLVNAGLVRADGTRDMKAARLHMVRVCIEEGIPIVRTDAHFDKPKYTLEQRVAKGLKPKCKDVDGNPLDDGHEDCAEHVCLDAEACERTGDELLVAYAERTTLGKQLSNDLPALEAGIVYPIHTRYGLAGTGRSTSSKPNIQNQSNRPGFREAFIARPGYVFVQNDYPTLELFTLAQCCLTWFGESKLAEALRMGDPHLWVASIILRQTLEWCKEHKKDPVVQLARKQSKPLNFGLPGGMGAPKFVASTRKAIIKTEGRAAWEELQLDAGAYKDDKGKDRFPVVEKLRQDWLTAFPEMERHFARGRDLVDTDDGLAFVETLFTGRWRGKATYCAALNNGFQALGSDCAKNAVWKVAEAQYTKRSSPLFNARTVAFVHDELILEVKDDGQRVHDAALELAKVMADAANEFLPDIPIPLERMEPTAMKRWSKKAKQKFDDSMRLIAWDI